jgi:hypothetical protein
MVWISIFFPVKEKKKKQNARNPQQGMTTPITVAFDNPPLPAGMFTNFYIKRNLYDRGPHTSV